MEHLDGEACPGSTCPKGGTCSTFYTVAGALITILFRYNYMVNVTST